MPQMAPLLWLNLMFMFLFTFGLFIILNYYIYTPLKTEFNKEGIIIEQKHWKW
uniref:ATP synthase F0 subunit 8 n=1 Tax=Dardanus arrosor TaxID=1070701 RepID=UPI001EDF614E|nr:ATP synthase F0 subunit 8 [Dardanus arrosor]UIR97902.1 ATP synthase protein 8 [Dardanus arrosor]